MTRTIALTCCLALLTATLIPASWAWGNPNLRKKTQAQMEREVALKVTATVIENKTTRDSNTMRVLFFATIKIKTVKAKSKALRSALAAGAVVKFEKVCVYGKSGVSHYHCNSSWAPIPAAFKKKKGSQIKISLRILRSAGRIVFATVSATIPETGVIKGSVVRK